MTQAQKRFNQREIERKATVTKPKDNLGKAMTKKSNDTNGVTLVIVIVVIVIASNVASRLMGL